MLVVMSTADLNKNHADREFFRTFLLGERITMQGFEKSVCDDIPTGLIQKAAGNTYPIPLLMAQLWPILNSIAMTANLPKIDGWKKPRDLPKFNETMERLREALMNKNGDPIFDNLRPDNVAGAAKAKAKSKAKPRGKTQRKAKAKATSCRMPWSQGSSTARINHG